MPYYNQGIIEIEELAKSETPFNETRVYRGGGTMRIVSYSYTATPGMGR